MNLPYFFFSSSLHLTSLVFCRSEVLKWLYFLNVKLKKLICCGSCASHTVNGDSLSYLSFDLAFTRWRVPVYSNSCESCYIFSVAFAILSQFSCIFLEKQRSTLNKIFVALWFYSKFMKKHTHFDFFPYFLLVICNYDNLQFWPLLIFSEKHTQWFQDLLSECFESHLCIGLRLFFFKNIVVY